MRLSGDAVRNIAVVAGFLFVVDLILYRDPGVVLSHGYEICAISPGSPCVLEYSVWHDDRSRSDWKAMQMSSDGAISHFLMNSAGEQVDYNSEAEWRAATIEMNADPSPIAARLSGVTGYKADKNFAIGTFDGGYWMLDFATHQQTTWKSKEEWSRAVSTQTSLTTSWLHNPKGRLNQSREPVVLVFYGAIFAVALLVNLQRK